MPTYELRCRECGTRFELARPMARIDEPAPCPAGHQDTVRLLPTIAVTGLSGRGAPAAASAPASGGGCCGGGCGCG
jgi:putative FmdB family regulatory protein